MSKTKAKKAAAAAKSAAIAPTTAKPQPKPKPKPPQVKVTPAAEPSQPKASVKPPPPKPQPGGKAKAKQSQSQSQPTPVPQSQPVRVQNMYTQPQQAPPVHLPQPTRQLSAPPGLSGPSLSQSSAVSTASFVSARATVRLPSPPGISSSRSLEPEEAVSAALEELQLLDDDSLGAHGRSRDHELRTAPIFTREAYMELGFAGRTTQYGVLGRVLETCSGTETEVPDELSRMYVNTNTPFSAIVCGVQGSGKSHTVSVLLESMFIPNCTPIGSLEKPLCGLVLHFGEGGPSSRPCEASWVGVPSFQGVNVPPVRVFVSRSSLNTMRAVYAPLGDNVTVEPLLFSEAELDAEAFLSMMAVSSESAPLYVQIILSILRDLGENYSYRQFILQLEEHKKNFNPAQLAGLEQRMSLLQSFMDKGPPGMQRRPRFAAGQLTIIDMSDPFIDPASACGLFEIVTRLFVRADVGTGKVLVVDEAHKYLSSNKGNTGLTKSLLTLTREQRHLAMRVLISTQEPTVVPAVLLDLCTVAILHRFQSPNWWKHLAEHVSADVSAEDAFEKVVGLQTGEAIVLAPSGLHVTQAGKMGQLGRRYVVMKTRKRVTADGGASILVLE